MADGGSKDDDFAKSKDPGSAGPSGLTAFLDLLEEPALRQPDEKATGLSEDGLPFDEQPPEHSPVIGDIVPVLVPVPADGPYSYRVSDGQQVRPGQVVKVPLGPRHVIGIVWDFDQAESVEAKKLRPIAEVFDVPPISNDIRRFVDWVARYTLTPPGLVARMVARVPTALEPEKPIKGVRFTGVLPERETAARGKVIDLGKDGMAWSKSGLAAAAGVTPSVIDGLVKVGTFESVLLPPKPVADRLDPEHGRNSLSQAQKSAADHLVKAMDRSRLTVTLIDGVTGSGKTEVYFEAIARAVKKNKQVLLLVPEISLTAAFLDRFAERFGGRPTEWHSDLTPKQRERVWRAVATGEARVVVGARSALFLPFQSLGLIIVDEEHDMAYKQEDRAIYNARDMAVVRGHLGKFPVMLASATPSLETYVNARAGRYDRVTLPARVGAASLPEITALDMRSEGPDPGRWIAPALTGAIKEALEAGSQALLFLNRRGYAPLTLCRTCGYRFQCPDCSTWLVEHRFRNTLECHHCGHTQRKPDTCPACGSEESLVACGPGVERIHEEVADLFPDHRSIVLSSDMFSTAKRLKLELAAIARGEADIIIGTQLVAKGHNFPKLALVGVVDADLGLAHGDMRAAERTFQLLLQVTGRAGRAGGRSTAILQTYAPDHAVMQAILAGDRDRFYEAEAAERKKSGLPPYGRLVSFIVSANDKAAAMRYGHHLRQSAPRDPRIMVLGPAEAPLATVRGRHRVRLLIQAPKELDVQGYIRGWLNGADQPRGGVQLQIDVDPQSFW
ncbi:MAG: primosomal protein N' [Pseudomonadota bacterium]